MRSKDSNNHRMKTTEMANADLFRSQKMDVDNSISPDTPMKPCDDVDVDMGKVCATRTPPVNTNKYAKRVGAKKANQLEIADNAAAPDVLTSSEAKMYRALSARCNYLVKTAPTYPIPRRNYVVKSPCPP